MRAQTLNTLFLALALITGTGAALFDPFRTTTDDVATDGWAPNPDDSHEPRSSRDVLPTSEHDDLRDALQHDGEDGGDAPDTCPLEAEKPESHVIRAGEPVQGGLFPVAEAEALGLNDASDQYSLYIDRDQVGRPVFLDLQHAAPTVDLRPIAMDAQPWEHHVMVQGPLCGQVQFLEPTKEGLVFHPPEPGFYAIAIQADEEPPRGDEVPSVLALDRISCHPFCIGGWYNDAAGYELVATH